MAHGLGLGQARQADRRGAEEVAQIVGDTRLGLRQVDAALVPAAELEDQRLVLQQAPRAGERVGWT